MLESLKICLEKQLKQEATPEGTWTDILFRLGRAVKEIKQSTSQSSPKGDWTDHAFRLGQRFVEGSRSSNRQKSYGQGRLASQCRTNSMLVLADEVIE